VTFISELTADNKIRAIEGASIGACPLARRHPQSYAASRRSEMIRRNRRILLAAVGMVALVALASPGHRADIRIVAHQPGDLSPQRAQAVLDLGVASVSVLVTWSKRLGY
jgi:hypothetical protein